MLDIANTICIFLWLNNLNELLPSRLTNMINGIMIYELYLYFK